MTESPTRVSRSWDQLRADDNNLWYEYNGSPVALVFIHGIFSDSRSCWLRTEPSRAEGVFWPDLVRSDPRFDHPSIYLGGFYTDVDAGDYGFAECADELFRALKRTDEQGCPGPLSRPALVLVCHSTGGIVARYLIDRYENQLRDKQIGLVLIASPSYGSRLANRLAWLSAVYNNRLGKQLRWGDESLKDLDRRFTDLVRERRIPGLSGAEAFENHFIFHRRFFPDRSVVVTEESAGKYFGAPHMLRGTDHFTTVKPEGLRHPGHEFLVDFWQRNVAAVVGESPSSASDSLDPHRSTGVDDGILPLDYLEVQRQIIEHHAKWHVARAGVEAALQKFVGSNSRGYFIVTGGPGLGKTATACHLTTKLGAIHHLTKQSGGRADPRLIVCSLLSQMAARCGVPIDLSVDLPTLTKTFDKLLLKLACTAGPVTIVIDALDELPRELGLDLPFLPGDTLPDGAYVLLTSLRDTRLERLQERLADVPWRSHELGPLQDDEVRELLQQQPRALTPGELELIAQTSRGSPLYLRALAEELDSNPQFDLNELPAKVEGYFRRAIPVLPERAALTHVVGLLAVARTPLGERDLAEITGLDRLQIRDQAVTPILPFLLETSGAYSFYHESFGDFVRHELVDDTALREAHASIARWLLRPDRRTRDDAWRSLAYHLFESGNLEEFHHHIDEAFLREKVRRYGFAVLDDVELLTRSLLNAGAPGLLERSVAIVESLRTVAGGDLMADVERAVQFAQVVSRPDRVSVSRGVATPSVDLYVGMISKIGVSADFVEVVPIGPRLWVAIGDAPASGLKSAFVARFAANLFNRLVGKAPDASAGTVLGEIGRTIRPFEYFDRISMQCVALDPEAGRLRVANAGHPFPLLYCAQRKTCDQLQVRGPLLEGGQDDATEYRTRSAEIAPGDVLVLVSDGLTEGGRIQDPYGYRFADLLRNHASQSARVIGERILADWRTHPRSPDWVDDVTVVVAAIRPKS